LRRARHAPLALGWRVVAGRLELPPTVPAMTVTRALSVAGALLALAVSSLVAASAQTASASPSVSASPASPQAPVARRATPVPILMYHVVGNPRPGAPYPDLFVRDSDFRAQMRWLHRRGFHAVTLRAVWEHWRHGAPLPRRPVVISFDDGYRNVAQAGFRAMREHGWPGLLNLAVKNLRASGGLSPRQVRRLLGAGWELASHTLSHPDLTLLGARELRREVAASRATLRRLFDRPVDFFCYPAGRYDARVIAAVRRAGYLGATTTVEGLATPGAPFELPRVRVGRTDGVAGLAAALARVAPPGSRS
jgi:peptidoglycan/xylan/chitin deacetylase (PgdA/CDA1 family)